LAKLNDARRATFRAVGSALEEDLDHVFGGEALEGVLDGEAWEVAAEGVLELCCGEASSRDAELLEDALRDGVADGAAEDVGGGAADVVEEGEGGLEVYGVELAAPVEDGVEDRQAEDLGLGAGGHEAGEAWPWRSEARVDGAPELGRGGRAGELESAL